MHSYFVVKAFSVNTVLNIRIVSSVFTEGFCDIKWQLKLGLMESSL